MNARMEEDGTMVLIATSSIEAYALHNWDISKNSIRVDLEEYKKPVPVYGGIVSVPKGLIQI